MDCCLFVEAIFIKECGADDERLAMRKIRDLARAHNRFQRYTEDRKRLPHTAHDLARDPEFLYVLLSYAGGAPITTSPRKLQKDVSDRKVRAAIAELIRIVLEKKRGDSDVVLRTPKSASAKKKKRGAKT